MPRGKFRVGLVDQVFSSGSNLLPLFAVARVSDVDSFGQLSLALVALTAVLAIWRGYFGSSLTLLAASTNAVWVDARYALLLSLVGGSVIGALFFLVALCAGAQPVVLVVAAAIPLVLTQDIFRYATISAGDPLRAVYADLFWFIVSVVLFVATFVELNSISPSLIYGIWAVAGGASALYISCSLNLRPKVAGCAAWMATWDRHRHRLGVEASLGAVLSLVQATAIAAILGTSAVAALRGSASVLGPLSLVIGSLPIALVPELRRKVGMSVNDLWRSVRWIAWLLVAASIFIGACSRILPDSVGEVVLGESWAVVMPLIIVTAAEYVCQAWLAVHNAVFRATTRTGRVLVLRIVLSGGGTVAAIAAATVVGSAIGVALALALTAAVAATAATLTRRLL